MPISDMDYNIVLGVMPIFGPKTKYFFKMMMQLFKLKNRRRQLCSLECLFSNWEDDYAKKKNHFYSLISPLVLLPARHLLSQALGKGKLKLLLVATFCFKCVLSFKRSLCLENVFGNMLVILKVR